MSDRRLGVGTRRIMIAAGIAACLAIVAPRTTSAAEDSPVPERLLPLFVGLEAQFHLAYDASPPVYRDRIQYTLKVIEAWQRSGRTPRDEALLEAWAQDAVDRSLPGIRTQLAPIPAFSNPRSVETELAAPPSAPEPQAHAGIVVPPGPEGRAAAPPPLPEELQNTPVITARPEPTHITVRPRRAPQMRTATEPIAGADPAATWEQSAPTVSVAERLPAATAVPSPMPRVPPTVGEPPRISMAAPPATVADEAPTSRELERDDAAVAVPARVEERSRPAHPLNLDEYLARLVGHRMGVRRLEARMFEIQDPTAEQLARFVGEFEALSNQGALLTMYTALLPAELREAYGTPVSTADVGAVLRGMIQLRQTTLAEQKSASPGARDEHEGARLTSLAAKLARLTETMQGYPQE